MKYKKLITLCYIFILLSCSSKESNCSPVNQKEIKTSNNEDNIKESGFLIKDTLKKDVIYDDEFILRVIENDFKFSNLNMIYEPKEINERLFQNKHDKSKLDTMLFFIVNEDSIQLYKASGNEMPQKIVIHSEKMTIDSDIKIGVNKELFMKKFNLIVMSNILEVKDLEGGNIFTFYFRENNLFRIIYKSEYTD